MDDWFSDFHMPVVRQPRASAATYIRPNKTYDDMAGKNSSFVCTHIRGYPFISFKREPLLMYPQCIPFLSVALPSTVLLLITSLHLKLVLLPSTNSYPYPNYDNLKRWPFLRNKFLFNPTIIYLNYQADRVRALISGLLDPRGSSDRLA